MGASSLLINARPWEVRVALREGGRTVEFYVERPGERGVLNNVYRGKVMRVLRGMQAAFVDIGLERTGFLYVNDAIVPDPRHDQLAELEDTEGSVRRSGFRPPPLGDISEQVREGESVLVQVQKEAVGTKGARLTRQVSLPGRHLVWMPFSEHIGVSHRIEDEVERERLRAALQAIKPATGGFIVRTAAAGVDVDAVQREATVLIKLWQDLQGRYESAAAPSLVFEDLDLPLRATRDLFGSAIEEIVVDDAVQAERVRTFVSAFAPEIASRVVLHTDTEPLFERLGVERELKRALERRVWLKSGGTIIIEQTEALTVIDVNTGRYVGKSNLEATVTKINLEAVQEIAHQLRLRNIGGIVIIDFIDMADAANRQQILSALTEALERDRAKTMLVRMSEIGLVEMTRKRGRDSLSHLLAEPCPCCHGKGTVKAQQALVHDILRDLERSLAQAWRPTVRLQVHSSLVEPLAAWGAKHVEALEHRFGTRVLIVAEPASQRDAYTISAAA